jgi:hypothetical protein
MLWFDDDPRRRLEDKIARAVAHYKEKYGQLPTLCFVNPGTLNGGPDMAAGVRVQPARTVLPNHFWIGVGDPTARIAPAERKQDAGARGSQGKKGTKGKLASKRKTGHKVAGSQFAADARVPSVP